MRSPEKVALDEFLAHAETLAQLLAHPAYEAYVKLLVDYRVGLMEEMAQEPEHINVRLLQGFVGAIDEIIARPQRIVMTASNAMAEEEQDEKVIRTDIRKIVGIGADPEGDI